MLSKRDGQSADLGRKRRQLIAVKTQDSSAVKAPISGGSVDSWLSSRSRVWSAVKAPISGGSADSLFSERSSSSKFGRAGKNSGGRLVRVLSLRLSSGPCFSRLLIQSEKQPLQPRQLHEFHGNLGQAKAAKVQLFRVRCFCFCDASAERCHGRCPSLLWLCHALWPWSLRQLDNSPRKIGPGAAI